MSKTRLKLNDGIIDRFLRDFKEDTVQIDSIRLWLWNNFSARLEQTKTGNVLVFYDPVQAAYFILKYA